MDEWQYFDEWDEDENSIIRDGYRFTVNWASKGMWLMPFTRTGAFFLNDPVRANRRFR